MNETPEQNPNMPAKCPQCGAALLPGALAGLCPACLLQQGAADTANPAEPTGFEPPTVQEMARLFPQLEILSLLGRGGMGAVYKARQKALDRLVALKVLPPQTTSGAGFSDRFTREARALAKLNHPNIVTLYEFGEAEGMPFFIMEFVDGLNLRQVQKSGGLSAREALQIVPQICEALQFAHDEGIVHRDIKPENILLDKKGRVKIADFGIAKIMGRGDDSPSLTETNQAIGTPRYMAPEQVAHPQSVDHRADIYSLGVVFYEMLTGQLPQGKFGPPPSRVRGVQVDVRLDDVVLRALELEPDRRYQQASQVKSAVDTITGTAPPPPATNPDLLAQQIRARDPVLNIRHCFRRGWALVRSDFWPLIGINALVIALLAIANGAPVAQSGGNSTWTLQSSAIGILVNGPLAAGLFLHFLRRKRGDASGIETVFSGFTQRFLHLFLGGFATLALMGLGFLCFILPGIYLLVAWMFTLALIIDKRLDFWLAMELSRKTVTRHWWKFAAFWIIGFIVKYSGLVVLGFGLFFTAPIALAALVYAYDDIFGEGDSAAPPAPAGVGPQGTVILPAPVDRSKGGGKFPPSVVVGLAAVAIVLGFVAMVSLVHRINRGNRPMEFVAQAVEAEVNVTGRVVDALTGKPVAGARIADMFFNRGPDRAVREFWTDADGDYQLLTWNEGNHDIVVSAPDYEADKWSYPVQRRAGTSRVRRDFRLWPKSAAGTTAVSRPVFAQVIEKTLNAVDVDTQSACLDLDGGRLLELPGQWPSATDNPTTGPDSASDEARELVASRWRALTPSILKKGIDLVGGVGGDSVKTFLAATESVENDLFDNLTAEELIQREELNPDEAPAESPEAGETLEVGPSPTTQLFKTRDGAYGILQLQNAETPHAIRIRYKLTRPNQSTPPSNRPNEFRISRENLTGRIQAAAMMVDANHKDEAMSATAIDAAKSGEGDLARDALRQVISMSRRDSVSAEAVRVLARQGFRKPGLEIAQEIANVATRDHAMAELGTISAGAGDVRVAQSAIQQIVNSPKKDETSLEAVRLLVKEGLRKPAMEIAQSISNFGLRDRALAELAR